ncbi:MAG: L-seryl-tRNA(Sec) selenium transferase [Sandaracinus sp.]
MKRPTTETARRDALRALPAVHAVLAEPEVRALAERHGLALVTRAVRERIEHARASILAGEPPPAIDGAAIAERALTLAAGSLVRVLNATGVVVHTNLGRTPLAREAVLAMDHHASGYTTLEYDLARGERGHRHVHVRALLVELTGAEDAIVVNNNAAAVMLVLGTLAGGRSAIVSRGELVEIGGGFRIPDVVTQAGARLVEVGTTNRTHLRDYEDAIDDGAALLLKVHRSNFEVRGFVAEVSLAELAALGRARGLPVVYDAGSGCMPPLASITREPSIEDDVRAGASLVCFSGDKLLGGPQAGIVVGERALVERLRRSPLYRALRPGKLELAALGATLELWRDRPEALPIVRALRRTPEELEARARALAARCASEGVTLDTMPSVGRIGGGAAPSVELASHALVVRGPQASALAERLRRGSIPVIARVEDDAVWLDLRCVEPDDDDALAGALARALA